MQIKLVDVRLAFPDLFEAVQFDGKGEFRYGATFFIQKDSANHKKVEEAIAAVAADVFKAKAKAIVDGMRGNANKFCYTDGDAKTYDGAEGCMVLGARRKQKDGRPLVLLANRSQLEKDNGELYSGCYVDAKVDIWAQAGEYTGIRCTLIGVQFRRDGDSFSGAAKAKLDDFDDLSEGTEAEMV